MGNSELFEKACSCHYVIVSLRRCSHGLPFLPARGGDGGIDKVQPCRMDLQSYLCEFLSRLGVTNVAVYNSLDGRLLAPFQAAFRPASWEQAWVAMKEAFINQRRKYRLVFKTRHGPQLHAPSEPHFVGEFCSAAKACTQPIRDLSQQLPVRDTFVHFPGSVPAPTTTGHADDSVLL